jgi:hypothetical protein
MNHAMAVGANKRKIINVGFVLCAECRNWFCMMTLNEPQATIPVNY